MLLSFINYPTLAVTPHTSELGSTSVFFLSCIPELWYFTLLFLLSVELFILRLIDMMVFKNMECSVIFECVTLNHSLVIIAGIRRRWKISSEESLWDAPCMIQYTSC